MNLPQFAKKRMVTYLAQDGARFDADYYVAHHMPLVHEKWDAYGQTSARALLPEGKDVAYVAIAILDFENGAALDKALASPEAAAVFGDVPAFTDIAPVAQRCG